MKFEISDSWPPNKQKDHLFMLLVKENGHTFVFVFPDDPAKKLAVTAQFGVLAANPEIQFSWSDAANMSQRIMETR
jgi:hypothetical protein